jgi:hypothetical protein
MVLFNLNLYLDRPHGSLDIDVIRDFLHSLGLESNVRGDYFAANKVDLDEVSAGLAGVRIKDINEDGSLNKGYDAEDVLCEKSILLSHEP